MAALEIERVWLIECTRCANEGVSDEARSEDAQTDFRARGWTREDYRTFCPQCNGAVAGAQG